MRFDKIKSWVASLLVLALVACGGGGGDSGTPISGGGSTVVDGVADLQVRFASSSIDNTGTVTNLATVTAIDANGQGVAGKALTIKVDNNATYSIAATTGSTTAANGTVVATVNIGNDPTLRTITLTATFGSITRTGTFQVVGSRQVASDLTLTAPTSLQNTLTNTVTVTAVAVDANRNALANIPVSFKVDNGATFSPSGTVTGADGTITGVLRMGADQSNRDITVVATSGTVERTVKVSVVGAKLTPSSYSPQLEVNKTSKVVWVLTDNTGAAMVGYPVTVTSSTGTTSTGRSDVRGEFTYTFVTPASSQALTITGVAAGVTQAVTINVVGQVSVPPVTVLVKSASLSASPSVVAVNTAATDNNSAEIRALFIGENNRPVPNVRVWFDLNGDPQSIGGTLASTADGVLLYSDANGISRTTYTPGTRFSPKDGVSVRVCWDYLDFDRTKACPNAVITTLTVTSESLSVTIGTNGLIEVGGSTLTYVKRYAVQVVDSAGKAKPGVRVSPSVDVLGYYKGEYLFPAGESSWLRGGFGASYPILYPAGTSVPASSRLCSDGSCDTRSNAWARDTVGSAVATGGGGSTYCENEDLNRNGVAELFFDFSEGREIAEDQNGSAALTPARPALDPRKADVAISVEGSDLTNANGIVVLRLEYPQNIASWVSFNILVSASGVAGTEGRANFSGILPVDAAALTDAAKPPPFRASPYGTQFSPIYYRRPSADASVAGFWLCTNPN